MAAPKEERAPVADTEAQLAATTDPEEDPQDDEPTPFCSRRSVRFAIIAIAVLAIVVAIGLIFGTQRDTSESSARNGESIDPIPGVPDPTTAPITASPVTAAPVTAVPVTAVPDADTAVPVTTAPVTTAAPSIYGSSVQEVLTSVALGGGSEFANETTYQSQALAWLEGNKDVATFSEEKIIQRYALACFFYNTFGVKNAYTGDSPVEWMNDDKWITDDDECEWYGMECNEGDIVGIDLNSNSVTGSVPLEFGLLGRSLETLDLSGNTVANKDDELAWIANLTELTELYLYFCNFDSDGISTYIGALTKLERLDVSYTLMFGSFNAETVFANLQNLEYLELGGNLYGETIPTELSTLPSLSRLYIDNAMITGDLSFMANMPSIFELWVDYNDGLSGPIPTSIGNATTLASFSAGDCGLPGPIPSEIGRLTLMQQMWLHNNELTGAIPSELGYLEKMRTLHLEGNMLNGYMPTEVCDNTLTSLGSDCPATVDCVCCTCCGSPCVEGVSGSNGASFAVDIIIKHVALEDGAEFDDPESPQSRALEWVKNDSDPSVDSTSTIVQRYALAVIYFCSSTTSTGVTDSMYGGNNNVPAWKESEGWLTAASECDWFGVRCTPEGYVNGLDLPSNDLTGGIPKEISFLADHLIYLDISNNYVSGSHEELSWMATLTEVSYLDMHFCNFEFDGVPTYLGNLVNLEVLDISYNLFYGDLKGSIFSNMTKLSYLEMGGNSYNSSIPAEIASLPELQYLYSEFTHLSGDLSFIDHMDKIVEIWLDYNPDLVGTIPASIGSTTTLKSASFSDCGLSGSIPEEIGLLTNLEQLWLYNNELTGSIPSELSVLGNLTALHLEGNQLAGEMPSGICALRQTSLVALASDCKFPVPEVMCACCTCCESPCLDSETPDSHGLIDVLAAAGIELDDEGHSFEAFKWLEANSEIHTYSGATLIQRFSLASIYLATSSVATEYTQEKYGDAVPGWNQTDGWMSQRDECSWYGVTCDRDGAVSHLVLADNGLSGVFPQEVNLLSGSIKVLDIGGNIVAGFFDELDWIGSLTNLKELDVHSCNFHFTGIPEGIMALTKLEILDISYCLFFGPIDGSIFYNLNSLYHLEMGGNSFNSSIPTEITALPHLEFLYAESTDLIGDLTFIPGMDMIFELWVDFNPLLEGSIPSEIGSTTSLQSLSVADCGLTGTIPSSMGSLTNMQQMWLYNNRLTGTIPYQIEFLTLLQHFHTEGNMLSGIMPEGVCFLRESSLESLATDCTLPNPEVECDCCTCCGSPCAEQDGRVAGSGALSTAGVDYSGRVQTQAANWLDSSSLIQFSDEKIVQRYALAMIYLSTNGVTSDYTEIPAKEWKNSDGWMSDADECSWYGIQCDDNGFVNVTDLNSNDLTGSFPDETRLLGNSLIHLDISGNSIYNEGEDLSWISGLTVLQHFDAHLLNFKYDGVPPFFPSSLKTLDISYTLFFGELDGASFTELTNLEYLEIGGNYYGSALPVELLELPRLKYLYAGNTGLIGDLTFIPSMQHIFELWIDSNPGLGGPIPSEIGQTTTLASLSLSGCSLTGTIPTEVGLLANLQQLWLYNNTLTGSIPTEIASLTALATFQTQSNTLSGEMPASICELRDGLLDSLTTDCRGPEADVECTCCTCCEAPCYGDFAVNAQSVLEDNSILYQGRYQSIAYRWIRVDPALQTYTDWRVLQRFSLACLYYATYKTKNSYSDAHFGAGNAIPGWINQQGWVTPMNECEWHGIECDENGVVVSIKLPFNRLTGIMPSEIDLLSESLTHLDIGDNLVASEDEELAWIATLPKLTHLDVRFCNFRYDGIPPYLAALSRIEFLDISYTLFFGEIDGAVFVPLKKLRYLEMGGNFYEGTLPSEIISLPLLENLYAEQSELTGDLSFLNNIASIKELWLDQNPGIIGTIPRSIGEIVSLASISFSDCGLTGEIPSTLGLLTNMKQLWLFNNTLTGSIPSEISNLSSLHTLHTENNDLSGVMPQAICALRDNLGGNLTSLATDCLADPKPEVECFCCTCCQEECYSDEIISGSTTLFEAGIEPSSRYSIQASVWLNSLSSDILQTYTDDTILQKYALACIYLATNGVATVNTGSSTSSNPLPEWANSDGWLTEVHECTWFGVECNQDGMVTNLDLNYNNMTGFMPAETAILAPSLEYLDISGNQITNIGDELAWIQTLSELKHLDLHFNFFDYVGVPPYFVGLANLEFLDISYTLFFGDLDGSAFAGLNALTYLEMGGNSYGSSVPTEIVSLPSLENLYIDNAHLTGDLSFIDTANVMMFELWTDNNAQLGGSVPPSIGNMTALASLSVSNCGLSGSLPSEMGELASIKQMWFHNNTLTGSIPSEIAELSLLKVFHTDDNDMSGDMPASVCMLRDIFGGSLETLTADCSGAAPEVDCACCTCCVSPCF